MVINTKEILDNLGWDDGYAIPIASEENKSLMNEIQDCQNVLTQLKSELSVEGNAISSLREHTRNVDEACEEAVKIRKAKEKEIEAEHHLRKLTMLESSRLAKACKDIEKYLDEMHARSMTLESEINRYESQSNEFRSQLDADESTIQKWLDETAKRNDDNMALMKYAQMDESRAKELTLKLEKDSLQIRKKKQRLEEVTGDLKMTRVELDKASADYKALHAERQEIITEWNNTLEQILNTDKQINKDNETLAKLRSEKMEGEAIKKDQEIFLENERANNQDTQSRINFYEEQYSEVKQNIMLKEAETADIIGELKVLKTELNRTKKDLDKVRQEKKVLKKNLEKTERKLSGTKEYNESIKENMKQLTNAVQDAEVYNKKIAQMMHMDNYIQKELESEMDKLLDLDFKKSQQISRLEDQNKTLHARVSHTKIHINSIKNKASKLDGHIIRQNEIIYKDQYRINQVEQKLKIMQGDDKSEVYESMVHKAATLQKELDEKETAMKFLTQQTDRVQDTIRMLNTLLGKKKQKLDSVNTKLVEYELDDKSSVVELHNLRKKKKETLVQQNLLKLSVNRLQTAFKQHSDNVYSLEMQKLDVELSVKQRQIELANMADVLKTQQRLLNEEKQKINKELNEKISRIKKLKSKYEVFIALVGAEPEQDLTETAYMTRSVLAKEELILEGSLLDKKLRKAEKELEALTNTFNVMNERNSLYRQSQLKSGITEEDLFLKSSLEEAEEMLLIDSKAKRTAMKKCQREKEDLKAMIDQLEVQEQSLHNSCQLQSKKVSFLEKEVHAQELKLERVSKSIEKVLKNVRTDRGIQKAEFFLEQEDIRLRCLIERNYRVVVLVGNMIANFPQIGQRIFQLFAAAELPQPPLPGVPVRPYGLHSRGSSMYGSMGMTSPVSDRSIRTDYSEKK